MQYRVTDTDYITNDIDEVIDYCIHDDYHDAEDDYFEEWVNDTYDDVNIAGVTYSAYDILDKFDNLGDVECLYCEWAEDNDRDNARYELRHASNGETVYIQGYEVVCEDEEKDTDGDVYCPDGNDIELLREQISIEQMCLATAREYFENDKDAYLNLFQTIGA